MDPALQYGPSYSGSMAPITIFIIVIGILISSWLFGAVYTLLTRGNNPLELNKKEKEDDLPDS